MICKNKNKGFSLMELMVTIAIMAIFVAFLVPSYIESMQDARVEKDITKFESICIAFKTAMGEPEVRKEMENLGGETLEVVFAIDSSGKVVFEDGIIVGNTSKNFSKSNLWRNSYQSVGATYTTESTDFCEKYLIFKITPKKSNTTARCEYEIANSYTQGGT